MFELYKSRIVLLIAIILIMLTGCQENSQVRKPISFEKENLIAGKTIAKQKESSYLVYLYMPDDNCPKCREFNPILKQYSTMKNSLKVYKVNMYLPKEKETWAKYKVEGTPSIILMEKGKEKERLIGVKKLEDLPLGKKGKE